MSTTLVAPSTGSSAIILPDGTTVNVVGGLITVADKFVGACLNAGFTHVTVPMALSPVPARPPRMTTTQKNAVSNPVPGMEVFDTTLNKLCIRGASAWETITSA